jgi:uncharacterized damage-inducible protein DinB
VSARDALLVDLDHEMAVTRRVIARVPDTALAWKPHEKSFSLGSLAMHLAQIPRWGLRIMDSTGYDTGTAVNKIPPEAPTAEVLAAFDRHVGDFRQRLAAAVEGELDVTWTLRREGHLVFSMPRISALRIFLLHHLIHHRGQLTVYLRLQEVAIPPIYGSTADESL